MSISSFDPESLIAASITPFRENESLDLDRLASHIETLIEAGVGGIMVTAGCGEYANLTPEERKQVVTEAVRLVDGRAQVVAGVLAPSTREALDLAAHAAGAGVDALLVPPPYYIKPSFDGVEHHIRTIAEASGTAIIVYNIPGRTGLDLSLPQLLELSEIPGVVALKECARDLAAISLRIIGLEGRMAVLSGDDDLGFPTFMLGGTGAIWATTNLAPKLSVDLFNACVKGDTSYALELHNRVIQMFDAWMGPNHPGPLKEAMAIAGRPAGPARRPLMPMTAEQRRKLEAVLAANAPIE